MEKNFYQLLIGITMLLISASAFGQTTSLANVRPSTTAYLGWDGTGINTGSLEIRNNFMDQPINFFTNGQLRMTILGTDLPTFDGNIGIGSVTPYKAKVQVQNRTSPTGLLVISASSDLLNAVTGVWGRAEENDNNITVGGTFESIGEAGICYGVRASAGFDFRNFNLNGRFFFGGAFIANRPVEII